MKIPVNDGTGHPTLSATQFRTYGTGGFRLDGQEPVKGCPRLYKARYVENRVNTGQRADALRYGSLIHTCLFLMEEDGIGPDEALERAFEPDMPQEFWTEARDDLTRYLERGATPMDRFGTLQVEAELSALLYVDEEFGPIYYRGFVDWIGIDLNVEDVLHVVDYKTNRTPPKASDLTGDVQLRGYHWLVRENAARWVARRPTIVTHLDAIKFRDVDVVYTDEQIDDWHSWAVAVARKILRDEEAPAILNDGCAWCPVRNDCPAYETLPDFGRDVLEASETFASTALRLQWRDDANKVRLLLEKAVKAVDAEILAEVERDGEVVVGSERFSMEPAYVTRIDLPGLHRALGSTFYQVISTSKSAIERATKGWDTAAVAPVKACIERVPNGVSMVRGKVDDGSR